MMSTWICVRQRAGPLVKECRYQRPTLRKGDLPSVQREKQKILSMTKGALFRQVWRNFLGAMRRWRKDSFDYVYAIEGRHGDKRFHIHIKNTIEILNNILESDTFPLMSGYYTVIKKHDLRSVISLLSDLQTENEKLQKMYQEEKVVCHETQLELERMKKIMREDEVMVAPSEYPGSQKMEYSEVMRSEGGIVK